MSPKSKLTKPVAVYTRVSVQGRRSDEELMSHDLQRARIEGYLASKGMSAAKERFEDTDKTGRVMSRPAFDCALDGIRSGKYGGIAVARLSRFGRKTSGILDFIYELEGLGAAVIVLDPPIDTSTAAGRAMLTVFSAFVTMEAEQAVEQAAQVAAKKLAEGKGMGGWASLGYEFEILGEDSKGKAMRGWLVPSKDAEHVLAAYRLFVDGGTPGKVADYLNAQGLRTGRGRLWRIESTRQMLRNDVYIGVRKYGDVRIPNAHEAIVPAPLWRKAVRKLGWTYSAADGFKRIGGPLTRTRGEGHVLGGGLVKCGLCGGSLVKGSAAGKYGTLRCLTRGPGHPSIIYDKAREFIVEAALEHLGSWSYQRQEGGNAEEIEAARRRLANAQEALAEAEEMIGTKLPPEAKQVVAVEEAQAALDALDRSESVTQTFAVQPYQARERFDAMPVPMQRRVLHELIDRVVLKGGRGPVHERLDITFEDGSKYEYPEHVPIEDVEAFFDQAESEAKDLGLLPLPEQPRSSARCLTSHGGNVLHEYVPDEPETH